MPTLKHLFSFVNTNGRSQKPLYLLGLMILFWALYEGVVSYLTPIVITNNGFSETMMGIIIGTSSIAGAFFDFISCRIFKNTYYKRFFTIMFAICLIYPLVLFRAHSFLIFLLAMILWGIYYDLKNIGNFDYVSRFTDRSKYSDSFGLLLVFLSIGLLVSPIIVGAFVADTLDWKPFALAWIFLAISIFFFIALSFASKKGKELQIEKHRERGIFSEVKIWGEIGKILMPALVLTLFLNIIDAFFWTIGPLFAESLSEGNKFAGFFMTAYLLPALLVGWIVGSITAKHGKKKTAFISLLIGSILLATLNFIDNSFLVILTVFISSIFIAMSWPAINGAYADYVHETQEYEQEIEGLEDFYTNLGYIIGPILAGLLADKLSNSSAFSILGVAGCFISIGLILLTPKKINLYKELKNTGVKEIQAKA